MQLMYKNRIEKVLVLDTNKDLSGLVTMKDIEKSAQHPNATKDDSEDSGLLQQLVQNKIL